MSSLTRACRIKNDIVHNKLPIHKEFLRLLVKKLRLLLDQQPYLLTMYKALFLTVYFGLFRIGELTKSKHVIRAVNTHVGENKKKIMFVLYSSKTHDQSNKPQIIKINSPHSGRNPGNQLCPFHAISEYFAIRKKFRSDEKQLFVFSDRSPVLPGHARIVLQKLIKDSGLSPKSYSFQGFRSGRSCDLLDMGVSVETIKKLG